MVSDLRLLPRVLMVSYWYPPSIGGLARQAQLLARNLAVLGAQVSVVTTSLPGAPRCESAGGLSVYRLATFPRGYRRRLYAWFFPLVLFLIVRRCDYDVIHVHQALYAAAICVALGKLLGKRTIVKVSGGGASGNMATLRQLWLGWAALAVLRHADCIVSLSEEISEELRAGGFSPEIIVRIPNGVDIRQFQDVERRGGKLAEHTVLTAGRLAWEKGVDVLIQAWPEVITRCEKARLLILADGPERQSLMRLAGRLNVANLITFAGEVPQPEVPAYLAASHVFVLPSRHEGMSNALLEALAAGVACLVSDIPANREVIQPDVNGMMFRSEDPHDLALKLLTLLGNDSLREKLGLAGLQTAIERYSIEAVAGRYLQLYKTLQDSNRY